MLRNINLTLPPGVVGLLGPNGSGKSTLIKAILGLVSVDAGRGRVLQFSWPEQSRALRDQIGYLPEDDCYLQGLQGIESIQMMARLSGLHRTEALRRSHEVADLCDLDQERYRNVETYSTGMRQKLKFAQALVHDPQWLILDEPTTGLDPSQREQFLSRIDTLAKEKGKSILLSTHILHDVQRVCDHVVILAKGEIRLVDSLARLQQPTQAGLQVGLVSDAERFMVGLTRGGIQSRRTGECEIQVLGDGPEIVKRIWSTSYETGIPIQRIDQARNSLEQAFLDAIRDSGRVTTGDSTAIDNNVSLPEYR
ncbi:MAG: ABC transporter ATP-binding protein [Pirellula sp.]